VHRKQLDDVDFVVMHTKDVLPAQFSYIHPECKFYQIKEDDYKYVAAWNQPCRESNSVFFKFDKYLVSDGPVIFIDSDMICLGDISHLKAIARNTKEVCACTTSKRFNSGMVIHPAGFNPRDECLKLAKKMAGDYRIGDQDIEERTLRGNWKRLNSDIYNAWTRHYIKHQNPQTRLLHFIGCKKPWQGGHPELSGLWKKEYTRQ